MMVRPILLTSLKNNLTKPFDLLFIDSLTVSSPFNASNATLA